MTKQNEKDAKRVPELRFKGFTDDWEQRKLGEIAEEVKGNSGSINNIPILTISAANGWMNQKDRFSQIIAGNELKKYTLLKKGELSYNHGNSKLAKYGTVFVQDSHDQALVPRVYHSFKMVAQNNPYFIEYLFASGLPNKELSKIVTSGARVDGLLNINKKEFFSIKLNSPSSEEQSRIAKLFQSLDKTITLHEEQHRQLERLKKALLQKMFADKTGYPALRFKGFAEKWEQSYLKDIASVNSGRDYKHLNKGNIPVYGTGGYMLSVDKALSNTKDGIGIGRKGTINNPYILKAPFWTVDTLFYVIPYNVDLNFLYGIFQKIDWRKKDESTGVPSLSKENINKTKFKIPAISEQREIGTIFQNLDTLITLHQHKIDNLKRLKRALLQKMFV